MLRRLHYCRPGWTYHAKGVWLWADADGRSGASSSDVSSTAEAAASRGPLLSVVGSSNLSVRSTTRDVELSACLVCTDGAVRSQLQDEQARLVARARAVGDGAPSAPPSILARCLAVLLRRWC